MPFFEAGQTDYIHRLNVLSNIQLSTALIGKPLADDKLILYKAVRPFNLLVGLPSSHIGSEIAADSVYVVTLFKGASEIGSIIWAAAATVPVVTFISDVSFLAGDKLIAECQSAVDATITDISLSIIGELV